MHEARVRARARMIPRAFVEELTRSGGDDAAAQAAVAGLVVLRTVDRWVAEGCRSGFDVAGAMATVQSVDPGQSTPALLERVLDAIAGGGPDSASTVADWLLKYGKALEMDAKWHLALAVYDAIVDHAGAASPETAVAHALTREGYCLRVLGRFEDSRRSHLRARQIAERTGDLTNVMLADLGRARTDAAQGFSAKADAEFRRVVQCAEQAALPRLQSLALHECAVMAGNRGDLADAARLAYAALQLCESPSDRDRILTDIGENFRRLGMRDAARDAFLILSCTARDQYCCWMSLILLMRIAADDGAGKSFRKYRRMLDSAPLPLPLQIELALQVGYGLRALGMEGPSRTAFRRAASLAKTHRFTRELQVIEHAIAGRSDCVEEPATVTPSDLETIVGGLRAMREAAVAG